MCVDSAILNLTERMCRRFQAWTGRTNIWLAFQFTNLSIVGGLFFMLTRTIFRTSIEVSEAEAYRRLAQGLGNPRRFRDVRLRIAFLTLTMVLSYPLWEGNAMHPCGHSNRTPGTAAKGDPA